MNILITGPKHCGKSTIISKILSNYSGSFSGFITEYDNRTSQTRELILRSIDGSLSRCAVKWADSRHETRHDIFDEFAPSLIDTSCSLVIIDELGKFEKNSTMLKAAVENVMSSPCHFVCSIRLDAEGWMQALKDRDDAAVIYVDESNRDAIPPKILTMISEC